MGAGHGDVHVRGAGAHVRDLAQHVLLGELVHQDALERHRGEVGAVAVGRAKAQAQHVAPLGLAGDQDLLGLAGDQEAQERVAVLVALVGAGGAVVTAAGLAVAAGVAGAVRALAQLLLEAGHALLAGDLGLQLAELGLHVLVVLVLVGVQVAVLGRGRVEQGAHVLHDAGALLAKFGDTIHDQFPPCSLRSSFRLRILIRPAPCGGCSRCSMCSCQTASALRAATDVCS